MSAKWLSGSLYRGLCLLAALGLLGCQRSEAEIRADITAEVQRINACGTVDDCQQIRLLCDSVVIGCGADRTRFDALVDELRGDGGPVSCTLDCRCGVISCSAGRCATRAGDCTPNVGPNERSTCL